MRNSTDAIASKYTEKLIKLMTVVGSNIIDGSVMVEMIVAVVTGVTVLRVTEGDGDAAR